MKGLIEMAYYSVLAITGIYTVYLLLCSAIDAESCVRLITLVSAFI